MYVIILPVFQDCQNTIYLYRRSLAEVTPAEYERDSICITYILNGKTPGTDGPTAEFYKFVWNDIKDLLLSSIIYALEYGGLPTEQRRGIISLLPQKDKDRLYLKNWRPISLFDVDYKILALGKRIISFLPNLIDEDQTGYMKKRFIGNNIRIIEDILLFTYSN